MSLNGKIITSKSNLTSTQLEMLQSAVDHLNLDPKNRPGDIFTDCICQFIIQKYTD